MQMCRLYLREQKKQIIEHKLKTRLQHPKTTLLVYIRRNFLKIAIGIAYLKANIHFFK